jgi:hypothetical protein
MAKCFEPDDDDRALIVKFLKRKNRRRYKHNTTENFKISYPVYGGEHVSERPNGYQALFKRNGYWLLNLDHGRTMSDEREDEMRAWLNEICAENGVDNLIPVSERAFGTFIRTRSKVRRVARDGYECVFTIDNRYYLSGYDTQENPPLYFLCSLPKSAYTVAHAREVLKPMSVVIAESKNLEVKRQGDLFFVRTEMQTDEHLVGRSLYGTNHRAAKSVTLPSGVMMASGQITHRPPARTPDHKTITLEGWWIVARNTVPATAQQPAVQAQPKTQQNWVTGDSPTTSTPTVQNWVNPSFRATHIAANASHSVDANYSEIHDYVGSPEDFDETSSTREEGTA